MKKSDTTNTFQDGLISDFNPIVTPNTTLTNALNATFITMNGNEQVLLNDMGNGRVETAYLPEGYIPLGTTLLGGIIYIVSYNPLINKCLIGSFPSPERNVTSDELGDTTKSLVTSIFYSSDSDFSDAFTSYVISPSHKLTLLDTTLNPGDKYIVFSEDIESLDYISAKILELVLPNANLYPKYLKLSIIAILDNGKISELNDTVTWYAYDTNNNGYYIYPGTVTMTDDTLDLDEYRNLVLSNYSVFTSKVSGKLGVLALLEVIDTFEVAWDAYKNADGQWNIYFLLNWSYDNSLSYDKINLYGLKVVESGKETESLDIVIKTYPKSDNSLLDSDNDALSNLEVTFYTPTYVKNLSSYEEDVYSTNEGITTARYNNGTDNQFFLGTPYTIQSTTGIVTLEISPVMPFGVLDYLKQFLSIDLDALGSGNIDLTAYHYYWEESQVTLTWALEAYPELNKSINSVTLTFYEYNSNVSAWIQKNASYIDYGRVETTTNGTYWCTENSDEWKEDGEEDSENILYSRSSDYELTLDNKSSYSGYFTNVIEGLTNGTLYLVAITINYNDEKTITYYRFLYTSKIFNEYYFNVEDFRDIVLQDALDAYYPITISASNFNTNFVKSEVLTDNDGSEVSEFSYALKETNSNYKYNLTSTYSNSTITFDVTAKNDIFEVLIDEISTDSEDIDITDSNNAEETTLYSTTSNSSSTANLSSISLSIEIGNVEVEVENDGTASGSFTVSGTLETPFLVNYSKSELITAAYEMQLLSYQLVDLIVWGRDKKICITAENGSTYYEGDTDSAYADSYGDDKHNEGKITYYSNTYDLLEEFIAARDMLLIRFFGSCYSLKSNPMLITYMGSLWHKYQIAIGSGTTYENNTQCQVCYALKNSNGVVTLFSPRLTGINSSKTYYSAAICDLYDKSKYATSSYRKAVCTHKALTEEVLFKPFSNIYKAVSTSSTVTMYTYYFVSYYDNYTWTAIFKIPCNETISIIINNVELAYSENMPNNLYYTKELSTPITGNLSDVIYTDSYINNMSSSTYSFVLLDGNAIETEVSPTKLYNASLEEVTYMIAPDGSITEPTEMYDSRNMTIKVNNSTGLLYIDSTNAIANSSQVTIEELSIKITNIYDLLKS